MDHLCAPDRLFIAEMSEWNQVLTHKRTDEERTMTIALTSDQRDLAEAVAGFTARYAAVGDTRAAFGKIAAGEVQPSWQALVSQRLHAVHLPEWAVMPPAARGGRPRCWTPEHGSAGAVPRRCRRARRA